jgi:Protein of unknown function (DUF3128)
MTTLIKIARWRYHNFVPMTQSSDVVKISHFFDEWIRCLGSRYQSDHVYRYGKFSSCSNQLQDLGIAFQAKVCKTSGEAENLLSTTSYHRRLGSNPKNSPTAGVIWELKETPGW